MGRKKSYNITTQELKRTYRARKSKGLIKPRPVFTEAQKEEQRELMKTHRWEEVVQKLGVSRSTCYKRIKELL